MKLWEEQLARIVLRFRHLKFLCPPQIVPVYRKWAIFWKLTDNGFVCEITRTFKHIDFIAKCVVKESCLFGRKAMQWHGKLLMEFQILL